MNISGSPWRDFITSDAVVEEPMLTDAEWIWLQQVAKLSSRDCDVKNVMKPTCRLELCHNTFQLSMNRSRAFPQDPPNITCDFQGGFSFDWAFDPVDSSKSSSLSSVIEQYITYCEEIDEVIGILRNVEDYRHLSVISIKEDPDDSDCLILTLNYREFDFDDETLELSISWKFPEEFPRRLSSSNPARFQQLNCDLWRPERSLSENILTCCRGALDDQ